jgi:RHS repeat-associated protein
LGNQTAGPANVLPIGYAGMLFDSASGLNTTWFRSYDPGIGRWLSRDPLGEGSDPAANLYRYADGNPILFTDPGGTGPFGFAIGFIIGAATASESGPGAFEAGLAAGNALSALEDAIFGGPGASGGNACPPAPDQNKLNHIFNNPGHNLDPLVQQFGSEEAAYNAVQQAVIEQQPTAILGQYSTDVTVGGYDVTVTGNYAGGGLPRIGTFYIQQ